MLTVYQEFTTLSSGAAQALTVFTGGVEFIELIDKRALDRELQSILPLMQCGLTFFRQDGN